MAKVRIIIKGIGISYPKDDGIWRVLFPFDSGHTVKFRVGDDTAGGMSLAAARRQIRVRVEDPRSRFETGKGYEQVFDMTAGYSHEDGVRMKSDWAENSVLMTLENAVLSENEVAQRRFIVKEGDVVRTELAALALSVKAELEGRRVIIEVTGEGGFVMAFEQDATLVFDNDCLDLNKGITTDMQMVYKILEDKNEESRKITVEVPDLVLSPELEEKQKILAELTHLMGSVVYTTDDPVLAALGVLCHPPKITNVVGSVGLP